MLALLGPCRVGSPRFLGSVALLLLCCLSGCDEVVLNQTASLGGSTVGGRGTVRAVFINNTPDRVVFTAGTFDQTDQLSRPDFVQFSLDGARQLGANGVSSIETFSCGRAFAIGTSRLQSLIRANASDASPEQSSLVDGVEFFSSDTMNGGSPDTSLGFAKPFEALIGVDFPCGALLVIRFEVSDAGGDPFQVTFQLIPATSTR